MENFRSLPANNYNNNLHEYHQKIQTPANKLAATTIEKKPIKVKYISNPMMVKANNESEFRAIVQKLTGQHSLDHAFHQSPQQFNQDLYPPPPLPSSSMVSAPEPKDCYGSVSSDVYDPIGVGEGRYGRGEMEGYCSNFSGFQASSSCVDIW